MIRISVLIPARGRPEHLTECVKSIIDLAAKPQEIEVLVRIDVEDETMKGWSYPGVRVVRGIGNGYFDLHIYLNDLAARAVGKWFFLMNDDARVETQDWDTQIGPYQPLGYLSGMATSGIGTGVGIFPIVPRFIYDTLGTLARYHGWDSYLGKVYELMEIPVVYIPINVAHLDAKLLEEGNVHTVEVQRIRATHFDFNNQNDFFMALYELARLDAEKLKCQSRS